MFNNLVDMIEPICQQIDYNHYICIEGTLKSINKFFQLQINLYSVLSMSFAITYL